MDKHALTQFFLWCTIMNGGLLLTWSTAYWLPRISCTDEHQMGSHLAGTANVAVYAFLGLFRYWFCSSMSFLCLPC